MAKRRRGFSEETLLLLVLLLIGLSSLAAAMVFSVVVTVAVVGKPVPAVLEVVRSPEVSLTATPADGEAPTPVEVETPTATPPDTRTPVTTLLGITSDTVDLGGEITVNVTASAEAPGIGAYTIDVVYDVSLVRAIDCTPAIGSCDDIAFNTRRFEGSSVSGLTGSLTLGTITFGAATSPGVATLDVQLVKLVDPSGSDIRAILTDGTITIEEAAPTPMSIVLFEVDPQNCKFVVNWTVTGDLKGTVELLRDGTVIDTSTIIGKPVSYVDSLTNEGTVTLKHQLRATNSVGQTVLSKQTTVTTSCVN